MAPPSAEERQLNTRARNTNPTTSSEVRVVRRFAVNYRAQPVEEKLKELLHHSLHDCGPQVSLCVANGMDKDASFVGWTIKNGLRCTGLLKRSR